LDSDEDLNREVAKDVISCELTKFEFSEALALKPTSLFVENMFKIVDKDDNGFISFREFLDMIVIFSKGRDIHCLNEKKYLNNVINS
jgi:dual oxidase